jgi:hypothetical protein
VTIPPLRRYTLYRLYILYSKTHLILPITPLKPTFSPLNQGDCEFVSEIKGGSVPKEYIPGVQKGILSVLSAGMYVCMYTTPY